MMCFKIFSPVAVARFSTVAAASAVALQQGIAQQSTQKNVAPVTREPALHVQLLPPPIAYHAPLDSSRRLLATQAWMNVEYERSRSHALSVFALSSHYPKDSLLHVAAARANQWITQLQRARVRGLQLDPYGILSVIANRDSLANQQIAARLAEPGMTLYDKAFTLQMAVSAFANADFPDRFPVAEKYLRQLDALGNDAALWRLRARTPLVRGYYRLGRSESLARVGEELFRLTEFVPCPWRSVSTYDDERIKLLYSMVITAFSGRPDGRAKIRALNEYLSAHAVPPAEAIAHDSNAVWTGRGHLDVLKYSLLVSERVGMPGAPIAASYWLNRGPSRDSQMVQVNDGRVRIIEIGSYGCPPCMAAVPGLGRLQQKYPGADFIFLTSTSGQWGNRPIDGKTECTRLAEHFVDKLRIRIPIGIATTVRYDTPEGLNPSRVVTDTWDSTHYPQASKPTFYVLDGKGIIRHVLLGYSRDFEENLGDIVEFLQREAAGGTQRTALGNRS
jgi:thiol-disulfide isomerase/thioredoxin